MRISFTRVNCHLHGVDSLALSVGRLEFAAERLFVDGHLGHPAETVNNDGTNNFIIVTPPAGNLFFRLKQ